MHMMQLLEDKVVALLELVESLKKENGCFKKEALAAGQEIAQLKKQIEMLESSVLNESHRLQELNKEKELTRTVVDDLIRNIEALVESGNQS